MLKRREFVNASVAGCLVPFAAVPARAQGAPTIGRLSEGGAADFTVFRAAMQTLGHADVAIVDRPAGGQPARLPALATELVGLGVQLLWCVGSVATAAARDATRTTRIPIVTVSADAVGAGLVQNLARPEGNITGLTLIGTELVAKRLELMKELAPATRRIAAVTHGPGSAGVSIVADWLREGQAAAQRLQLGFDLAELPLDPALWDATFAALAMRSGTALSFIEYPYFLANRVMLADLTLKHRLPAVYTFQENVHAGGLFAYGVTLKYITERVAFYVSRILRGAKPGDLPVEQPTKYELAINLKTARALGLTVPTALRLRTDTLVE